MQTSEETRRDEKIRDIAFRSTSYQQCLIASLEYYGWEYVPWKNHYSGPEGFSIDMHFIEGPELRIERFAGKDAYEMSVEAWNRVSPMIKTIETILDFRRNHE